jgi:lipopolysaccharide export system permease protein
MQFLWRFIDDIVGKGLEWTVILEFLFYVTATLVPMALPLSILLASIMTFGNMGENYELTAMKAAGISLQRIMQPLTILIVIISVSALFFSNYIMPVANLKMGSMMYDIKKQNPELILKEGIFTNDLDKFSIKVGKIDKETGMIYDLLIYDHRDGMGNNHVTVADSGTMTPSADKQSMKLTLYSGNTYKEKKQTYKEKRKKNHPFQRVNFEVYVSNIALPGNDLKRTDEDRFRGHYRMLNLEQLITGQDSIQKLKKSIVENHAKSLTLRSYFKKESKSLRGDSIKKDLVLAQTLNADSLYTKLSLEDKLFSIENALMNARKVRENTSRKQNDVNTRRKEMQKYKNEWHRKFTLSFACLIFFFIGAPLGAIIRKGGLGMPVVVSVLFFIVYYIISMTTERFSKELVMSPFWGMWTSSLIILPIGVILTYQATTDSPVFNIENYIDFFKKINPMKYFKKKNA